MAFREAFLEKQLEASLSVAKATRASKQLRELHAAWQRAELEASKHRHVSAPSAERARVQAMEKFAECAAVALNLGEGGT